MSLYTVLLLFIFLGPFLISLWPPLNFWKRWQRLLAAFVVVSLPFIIWDVFMTKQAAWGFTPKFAGSIKFFSLPVGEWLFFFIVPFACLVMYEVLVFVNRKSVDMQLVIDQKSLSKNRQKKTRILLFILFLISIAIAIANVSQLYTQTVWLALAIALLTTAIINPLIIWQKTFWLYLLVSFAGFLVLNSILTGLPIVWYNPEAISNWRMGSIPVEDFVYNASLLILSLIVWQEWRVK